MIRIFLVEDHHIVRYGVKSLLETNPSYSVVGETEDPQELLDQIKTLKVDVIITDITMEGMNGIDLTKKIRQLTNNSIKILVLSMHADEIFISQCFKAGVNGYLLKDFKKTELFSAIEKVMKGEIYTSRSVSQLLANNYLNKEFKGKGINTSLEITRREKEIIELISLGLSNKEIAQKLLVSISTVDVHRYNILKKMEVKNTAEMIMKAIKLRIINLQT